MKLSLKLKLVTYIIEAIYVSAMQQQRAHNGAVAEVGRPMKGSVSILPQHIYFIK